MIKTGISVLDIYSPHQKIRYIKSMIQED